MIELSLTDPIKYHAKECTRTRRNPDVYVEQNDEIKHEYSKRLYEFLGIFIKNGKFSSKIAKQYASTDERKSFLINRISEFARLEYYWHVCHERITY